MPQIHLADMRVCSCDAQLILIFSSIFKLYSVVDCV